MATSPDEKRVHDLIVKRVKPLSDPALKAFQVAVDKLLLATKEATAAIREKQEPDSAEICQRELKISSSAMVENRVALEAALAELKEISKDKADFEAGLKEIKALTDRLDWAIAAATDSMRSAKGAADNLRKYLEATEASEKKAVDLWTTVVTVADRNEEKLKDEWPTRMQTWKKAADAAVASRNAKELKRLQDNPPVDVPDAVAKGAYNAAMISKFADATKGKVFSEDFTKEIASDKTRLAQSDKAMQKLALECKETIAKVAKLEVEARDAKKGASLLGMPSSASGKLGPILEMENSPMQKALEALAKELKITLSGKDAVAKLKRGGVL